MNDRKINRVTYYLTDEEYQKLVAFQIGKKNPFNSMTPNECAKFLAMERIGGFVRYTQPIQNKKVTMTLTLTPA